MQTCEPTGVAPTNSLLGEPRVCVFSRKCLFYRVEVFEKVFRKSSASKYWHKLFFFFFFFDNVS